MPLLVIGKTRCFQSSVEFPLLVIAGLIAIVTPNICACLTTVRTTSDKKTIRRRKQLKNERIAEKFGNIQNYDLLFLNI